MKRRDPKFSGVLLVDKPRGVTSHDVVAGVRRVFGQRQVGHTGTLDPMATGLLVLALGRATRIARFIEAADKSYIGTVTLGVATDSFDADGDVVRTEAVPELDRGQIDRALSTLVGSIAQTVPAFSAVKVKGERLYKKARRGENVEAPTRTVRIESLIATRWEAPEIDIEATVEKGTYIRSLAVQIGEALGRARDPGGADPGAGQTASLPAHLSMLRRTRVGALSVADATPLDALSTEIPLISVRQALDLPELQLDEATEREVSFGRPLTADRLDPDWPPGTEFSLIGADGGVCAVAQTRPAEADETDPAMRYACVLIGN